MIETTVDIRISPGGEECVIASNVEGETGQQAELVAFGHCVARIVSLLGPARAGGAVSLLLASRRPQPSMRDAGESAARVVVRFVDGASGPRIYFRFKLRRDLVAEPCISALRAALLERHADDSSFAGRLSGAAGLLGRLAATGQIRAQNEFDVALAVADVVWRSAGETTRSDLECPACGNAEAFEPSLWPSEEALLCRCPGCGAGIWQRGGHAARRMRGDIWAAMESIRAELSGTTRSTSTEHGDARPLFIELKRVFDENGWPYAEIEGAPVLVTELSGPEGRWDFYAQAVDEKGVVLLYSIAPQRVPEERRLEASEFLARANYGLADGNFELDFEDGEVRYKTVLHVHGDELDGLLVKRLVRSNGTALETYLPSLRALS